MNHLAVPVLCLLRRQVGSKAVGAAEGGAFLSGRCKDKASQAGCLFTPSHLCGASSCLYSPEWKPCPPLGAAWA